MLPDARHHWTLVDWKLQGHGVQIYKYTVHDAECRSDRLGGPGSLFLYTEYNGAEGALESPRVPSRPCIRIVYYGTSYSLILPIK
jgi:hypothetical protein